MVRRMLLVLIMLFAGCARPGGVQVSMDEYSVHADPRSAPAGSVTFRVRNVGAIAHQFLVLRTNRDAGDLPVRGGLVRTGSRGITEAGEIEVMTADASETVEITLAAGRYVLICNIAGHYDLGMRTGFRVTR